MQAGGSGAHHFAPDTPALEYLHDSPLEHKQSIIARTCGKLAPKDAAEGVCILCGRPAQPGVQE
ncbi:hypothetical protein DFH09DRAFT_1145273 [Mycena vulgaris]|nr:hypothetical protein DFH09DRAFT_1145273 [Mycena vulgaris]